MSKMLAKALGEIVLLTIGLLCTFDAYSQVFYKNDKLADAYTIVTKWPSLKDSLSLLRQFQKIKIADCIREQSRPYRIQVQFIIDKQGNVSNIEFSSNKYNIIDSTIVNILINSKWTPGLIYDDTVNVRMFEQFYIDFQ